MPVVASQEKRPNPNEVAQAILNDLERGEGPLTFLEATRHGAFCLRGRGVHVSQIHRWADLGVRGVRLGWIRVGGTKVTTPSAIQRFLAQSNSPVRPVEAVDA